MAFLKTCKRCGIQKLSNDYFEDISKVDKISIHCKECTKREKKFDIKTKKQNRRKSHLKYNYNITAQVYHEMFQNQCGYCYICLKHQDEFKKKLAVDHDHKTGKVRGLLCSSCNTALGHFRDSKELLQRAINYLDKNEEKDEKVSA